MYTHIVYTYVYTYIYVTGGHTHPPCVEATMLSRQMERVRPEAEKSRFKAARHEWGQVKTSTGRES